MILKKKRYKWGLAIAIWIVLIFLGNEGYELEATMLGLIYGILLLVLAVRWLFKEIRGIQQLKSERTTSELLHLKSQVNPHFFFNTLNNLYGLVGKDAKKAQNMILKLSDMMRYSIYDGQNDYVSLEEEIEYLKNYIELHKMRYHKKIDVQCNFEVQEEGYKVMPLLFIILLENAFKHGVENLTEDAYVNVNLVADDDSIHFNVENNFDVNQEKEDEGIGLKNLERRLELVYPGAHELSYSDSDGVYKAALTIKRI